MEVKVYTYDSFTKEKFKGNQAAVIPNADNLKKEDMQNIAKEFGYSESVFLLDSEKAIKKVKFFTPNSEVDLCGHATIAYIKYLIDINYFDLENGKNIVEMETNLGVLEIIIEKNSYEIESILMYQDDAQIKDISKENFNEIMEAMNLTLNEIGNLEIVKGYTGLWDLLIHLKNKKSLDGIRMDREKMMEISKKLDIISFHPFVLEEKDGEKIAYVRNFAPIVEIDEESATGTSNGALAYYLYDKGYLGENEYLVSKQGKSMGRESEIKSKISNGKVLVGGNAVKVIEGIIEL